MSDRNDALERARAGVLQCQAQIDVFETTIAENIDRLKEIAEQVVSSSSDRNLDDADIELLVIAGQVAVMRHIQSQFRQVLWEHGGDMP